MASPLWVPSADRIARANLTRFAAGRSYPDLWEWSIARPQEFWPAIWDFAAVRGERGERVAADPDRMPGARFFRDARLNFTENVLGADRDAPAVVYRSENGTARADLPALFSRVA